MASRDAFAPPVGVLVVDDQPPFHDAAHALITATAGFEWIGGAKSGEEAVEQVERLQPDLVLMDVRMPGIGGVEAARQIASREAPPIVVLMSAEAMPSGASHHAATEVIAKRELNAPLLRSLWERHRQGATNSPPLRSPR